MFFPYKIQISRSHFPLTNVLLIVGCVIVHFLVCVRFLPESLVNMMVLHDWSLSGFIGHQFLHGDILHILFNMVFLWIFGSVVNGRVGNLAYLGLYLACGVMAGALHFLLNGMPLVGASGAISGVMALCLVLFPTSRVKGLLCFGLFGCIMTVNAFWVTLIWFGRDVYSAIWGAKTMVAHWAHVGGFLAGGILGLAMLRCGLYKSEAGDDPTFIYYLVRLFHRKEIRDLEPEDLPESPSLMSLDMKFSSPPWIRWSVALLVIFGMPLLARAGLFNPLFLILACMQVAPDIADWFGDLAGGILYQRREGKRIPMYGIPEKLVTLGKYVEAEAEYEKIIEEFPEEIKPYIDLINVAVKRLNNAELAEQFYKKGMNALKKDEAKIQLEDVYFRVKTLLPDTSFKPDLKLGKDKQTVVKTLAESAADTVPVMAGRPTNLSRPPVIPKDKSWKFILLAFLGVAVVIFVYNLQKQAPKTPSSSQESRESAKARTQAGETSLTATEYAQKFVSVNFKLKYLTNELQGPGVYITGTLSNRGSKLVQNIRAYAEIRESGPNGQLVSKRDLDLGYIEAGQTRQITKIVHDLELKRDRPLVAGVLIYKAAW